MTKILVFSDTHGNTESMKAAVKRNQISANCVIHLGDGSDDCDEVMRDFPQIPCVSVRGNREDYLLSHRMISLPRETTLDFDGIRIFLCHGHEYGVKNSVTRLIYRAIEVGADIALYGHTHIPDYSVVKGRSDGSPLHILNPGSRGATFGIIEVDRGNIKISIENI